MTHSPPYIKRKLNTKLEVNPWIYSLLIVFTKHTGINILKLCKNGHFVLQNLVNCNPIRRINKRKLHTKLEVNPWIYSLLIVFTTPTGMNMLKLCNNRTAISFNGIWWNAIPSVVLTRSTGSFIPSLKLIGNLFSS